jgi:hypothetical protein
LSTLFEDQIKIERLEDESRYPFVASRRARHAAGAGVAGAQGRGRGCGGSGGGDRYPDTEVDLCLLPLAPLLTEAKNKGIEPFFVPLDESLIPSDTELAELTALEDIIMIGYPIGIWDSHNNMPVIRRGITATHPVIDYEDRKEFMIDSACFPGSSGSPVFLFSTGTYASRDGATVIGNRIKLLGILYGGPQFTAEGEIQIVNVPTHHKAVAMSRIPTNLGICIKSARLFEFEPILRALLATQS